MTDKNMVKLLVGLGVPKEKHDALIAKANNADEDMDVSEFLDFAKTFALPLLKPGIEKEAIKGANSGTIMKMFESIYEAEKEDDSPPFDEWKKTVDGKKVYDVMKESIANARTKGVSNEVAVKEATGKVTKLMEKLAAAETEKEALKTEYEGKLSAKDFEVSWDKTIKSFEKKPLKESSYKYFKNDLFDEGIEAKLHEGKIALFKKGETTPMQNEKGTAFVTLEEKYNAWAAENLGQFVNSAGNGGAGGGADPIVTGGKVSDDGKYVEKDGQRKMPTYA